MIKHYIEATNGKIYEVTEFTYDNKTWFSLERHSKIAMPDFVRLKFRTTEGIKTTQVSANWSEDDYTVIKFEKYI